MESTKSTLQSFSKRDRSPSVRDKPRLNLSTRHNTTDNLTNYGSLGRSPSYSGAHSPQIPYNFTDHGKLLKPKSILKKSNSNIESAITYVVGGGSGKGGEDDGPDYLGEYLGEEYSGSSEDEMDGNMNGCPVSVDNNR